MSAEKYTAGMLDRPVTIRRITNASTDGAGGFTTQTQDVATPWCFVRPLRGSERVLNDQLRAQVEILVVMHAAQAPLATDTLVLDGVAYNIRTIRPPGRSLFVEIEAESGVVL